MTAKEIRPLVFAASKAFKIQEAAGNIDLGETFDTWRHKECMEAVKKPGITACNHDDFRAVLSHFQHLAGDDVAAFKNLITTGPENDHAAPGDTHEMRRHLVHEIEEALAIHTHLATAPAEQLLAECVAVFSINQPGVAWENTAGPAAYSRLMDRRAAIEAKGKGPITVGYLVYLVRQKTRRPDLTLGQDWQAGLAERCTVHQLRQIVSTVVNRIAAVEGTGDPKARNKSQRILRR